MRSRFYATLLAAVRRRPILLVMLGACADARSEAPTVRRPIDTNTTDKGRARNRRVVFTTIEREP
jgi:hypothetical protein